VQKVNTLVNCDDWLFIHFCSLMGFGPSRAIHLELDL